MNRQIVILTKPGAKTLTVRVPVEDNIEDCLKKALTIDPKARIIYESELPSEREFRDAWEDNGILIAPEVGKAREVKLSRVRRNRRLKLQELDTEMLRAMEDSDTVKQAEIKSKKQQLRDITEPLKTFKTFEEIRNYKTGDL